MDLAVKHGGTGAGGETGGQYSCRQEQLQWWWWCILGGNFDSITFSGSTVSTTKVDGGGGAIDH